MLSKDNISQQETVHVLDSSDFGFRLLAETSRDIILIHDMDGTIIYINPFGLELTGIARSAVVGKSITSFLPSGEMDNLRTRLADRLKGNRETFTYETAFLDRTGAHIPVEVQSVPVVLRKQNAEGILIIARDISDRKQSEARMRRLLNQHFAVNQLALTLGETQDLEKIYRVIYDHLRLLIDTETLDIAFYDSETQLIRAGFVVHNGHIQDTSGFPPIPLEPPGKGTQSQVIHTGRALYIPDYRAAMQQTDIEFSLHEDGSVRNGPPPEEAKGQSTHSALYVPMKIEARVIGVLQVQSYQLDGYSPEDQLLLQGMANVAAVAIQNARLYQEIEKELQERKRTEDLLEVERNLLRTLIDHLPNFIYVKDLESRNILVNQAAAQLVGSDKPETLIGKSDADVFQPELAEAYLQDDQQVIRSRKPLVNREEIWVNVATGESGWQLTNKLPLFDSNGQITGIVG
ncbi:MAG: PAS domain S-box protein, partial [Anaerolineae bacterium]|nr:PAS domain S-box protein [Anaerolineae bacterium]